MLLALVLSALSYPVQAADFPQANGTWDPGFFPPGLSGFAKTVAVDGDKVYAAGMFATAGDVVTDGIAMWDRQTHRWTALAREVEVSNASYAFEDLVIYNGDLIAAGRFTAIDGVEARFVARWNGKRWHPLGNGLPFVVPRLRVMDGVLYAIIPGECYVSLDGCGAWKWGGSRWLRVTNTQTHDIVVDGENTFISGTFGVTRRSGNDSFYTNWSNQVYSPRFLEMFQGSLYAAGDFSNLPPDGAANIARWDGEYWRPVGDGLPGDVDALLATEEGLYAVLNGPSTIPSVVMRWDGKSWSSTGETTSPRNVRPGQPIYDLADGGDEIFFAGLMRQINGSASHYLARWNRGSGQWSAAADERGLGLDGEVHDVARVGDEIFVVGDFWHAGPELAPFAAAWNGESWRWVGEGLENGDVWQIESGALGTFAAGRDGVPNGIAEYDGEKWQPFENVESVWARDLLLADDKLYVVDDVRFDGQESSVAVWDGQSWSSLWDRHFDNGPVYALGWFDAMLFIGGGFDDIGKLDIHTVAQRNGDQWLAVGSGLDGGNDYVETLAAIDDGLYASGHFTETDGKPANGLARWTGSEWEPLDDFETDWEGPPISAADGDLYVGPFPRIHRWNRSEWRTLGADVNGEASIVRGPDAIYAAGSFTAIGRHGAGRFARWLSCEDTEESCATTTTTSTTTTTTTTTVTTTSTTLPTTTTSSMPTNSSSTSSTTNIPEYCGDANHDGEVSASDALAALRTAVGLPQCELLDCDIDGNFAVTAIDALAVLRMAVGFVISGACPHT